MCRHRSAHEASHKVSSDDRGFLNLLASFFCSSIVNFSCPQRQVSGNHMCVNVLISFSCSAVVESSSPQQEASAKQVIEAVWIPFIAMAPVDSKSADAARVEMVYNTGFSVHVEFNG